MFIEHGGIHQTQQSPRGATCDSGIREVLFNAKTQRRKEKQENEDVFTGKRDDVGVGVPQPVGRGDLAPTNGGKN